MAPIACARRKAYHRAVSKGCSAKMAMKIHNNEEKSNVKSRLPFLSDRGDAAHHRIGAPPCQADAASAPRRRLRSGRILDDGIELLQRVTGY
jgi:hypothetical protein